MLEVQRPNGGHPSRGSSLHEPGSAGIPAGGLLMTLAGEDAGAPGDGWVQGPNACGKKRKGALHEPTHSRRFQRMEQAFVRARRVPYLGEVRGGFMVRRRAKNGVKVPGKTDSPESAAHVTNVRSHEC
jgi:hypothetical protein